MADILEAVHGAVATTCTTMYEKDDLPDVGLDKIMEAVRPEEASVAEKSTSFAQRILFECAVTQGEPLPLQVTDVADWVAENQSSSVSDLVSYLESLA